MVDQEFPLLFHLSYFHEFDPNIELYAVTSLTNRLLAIVTPWSDQYAPYMGSRSRVVQTKALLFLKSMSERVGSDIRRLRNRMMNFLIDSKSIEDDVIEIQSCSRSNPTLSDIVFKN